MRKVHIYVLKTADDDEVRYVGQTVSPQSRFAAHRSLSDRRSNPEKAEWISGTLMSGLDVEMETVEECDLDTAAERERFWMEYYHALGHRLTNRVIARRSAARVEVNSNPPINFRPSEFDAAVLNGIQERNPHIPDAAGLLREALHRWHIEATDENSKTRRLERMEAAQGRMADEIAGLRQEIAELRRMLFETLRRPDGETR